MMKNSSNASIVFPLPEPERPAEVRPLKLALTVQEAADAIGIHRSTLYILVMEGQIPSVKFGRARRIRVKDLEQWLDNQVAA